MPYTKEIEKQETPRPLHTHWIETSDEEHLMRELTFGPVAACVNIEGWKDYE